MFSGAITALVTPIKNGAVDLEKLREFVEFQIAEKINGLVPCGTTGETSTLSEQEYADVIRTVVETTKKRVPVIAGAGANSTTKAIHFSKIAAECGADALLHVTPYYNKPTQTGLIAHYQAVAKSTKLPIVLYNVPGRTGCDLLPATIGELAKVSNIVAVKEATASIIRAQEVIAATSFNRNFATLSGDDFTCLAFCAIGGTGVISVVSNVTPRLFAQLIELTRNGQLKQANEINYRLLPLMNLLFCESNPIPAKAAVAFLGYSQNELRLPLAALQGEKLDQLHAEMKRLGL